MALTDYVSALGGLQNIPGSIPQQADAQALRTTELQQQAAQMQLQQQQVAQQRAQQFQSDLVTLGDNPEPAAIASMIRKYPEFASQLKTSNDIQDQAKQDSDFHTQAQIWGAANAGRFDLAAQLLQSHHDASVAAGQPEDPTDLALIQAFNSADPAEQKRATSMVGLAVAAARPKDFDATYKLTNPSTADAKVVGDYLVDDSGKVLFHSTKPEYKTVKNADGSETLVQVGGDETQDGAASPAASPSPSDASAPLPVRLNNPGAIRFDPKNQWQGQVGQQGGFVQFDTPADGQRAHMKLIANQIREGYDTPLAWAQHYAPSTDGNDPQAYAQTVAQGLGIGVNDKIPLSAVPKMAQLSAQVESGGTPSPAANGTSVPGVKKLFTSKGASADDIMSPDEINFYAQKVNGGADLPPLGMGKDAALVRRQILAKAADIAMNTGITAEQSNLLHSQLKANTSSLTALGKLQTFVNAAEQTASLNADQVLLLAPKGVAGGVPLFNAWVQAGRKNIAGNPDVSKFNLSLDTLANEYAKVMTSNTGSGGVTSEAAYDRAHSLLNNAQTLDQLKGTIQQMRVDMANRKSALARQNDILSGNISNAAANVNHPSAEGSAASGPPPGARPTGKFYQGKPVYQVNGRLWVAS